MIPVAGQRLHLFVRDHGRIRRVDHRMGFDPRICRRRAPTVSIAWSEYVNRVLSWFHMRMPVSMDAFAIRT